MHKLKTNLISRGLKFSGVLLGALLLAVAPVTNIALAEDAPAETVVVSPENEQGWTGADTAGTGGSHEYVDGPDTAPLGDGSLQIDAAAPTLVDTCFMPPIIPGGPCMLSSMPILTTNTYAYSTTEFNGTLLSDITGLSFQTYISGDPQTNPASPSLGMYVDFDIEAEGPTTISLKLFFMPTELTHNEWQEWDALDDEANYWCIKPVLSVGCNPLLETYYSFNMIRNVLLPTNSRISNNGSLFFSTGSSFSESGTHYSVDALNFATSSINKTFDFEQHQPVVTTPTTTVATTTNTTKTTTSNNPVVTPEEDQAPAVEADKTGQDTAGTSSGDTTPTTDTEDNSDKSGFNWWWLLLLLALLIALWYYLKRRSDKE